MRQRTLTIIMIGIFVLIVAGVYALGLARIERHSGFFAPVWDQQAGGVYFIQRDTIGASWGLGWEHFTPPAYSYVISDHFSLRYLNLVDNRVDVLQHWSNSPLEGRVTRHYRGRIFNTVSARVDLADGAVDVLIKMQIPRIPLSEQWSLRATWHDVQSDNAATARWVQTWSGSTAMVDGVLHQGLELMTVPGREFFPAAILAVEADGTYRVLQQNARFEALYSDGIPARTLAERSNRRRIERGRALEQKTAELVARYRADGLNDGAARLKANDDLEALGYLPRRPRLVATRLERAPDELAVFEIPAEYFTVGLFQDIAAAIAAPGTAVDTSTGTYLKYYDDELGLRLKAWRAAGNDRFVVRTSGALYLLEVRRSNAGVSTPRRWQPVLP